MFMILLRKRSFRMALGSKPKNDILKITGEITFDSIKAAIDYLDENNVTPMGETSYFMKDGNRIGYSFNQIIKTINNDIKNNSTQLKTGDVGTFEVEKIFKDIKIPDNYKLIFPWNNNGKEQIKAIRNTIIKYAKDLGYKLNDQPGDYTGLQYQNRNFAEVHYPDRDSKIRVDVFYDRLPQKFRNKFGKRLERYPDTHKYSLNGKYLVTLDPKTVEQLKEILKYSYEHGKEILNNKVQNLTTTINNEKEGIKINTNNVPLNQILYGPPGTGKTYSTAKLALQIIDPDFKSDNRQEILSKYNEYKKSKQIQFVTFHQSYSYEEFVEGIRPVISDNGNTIIYEPHDGIFKNIVDLAKKNLYQNNDDTPVKYADFDEVIEEFKNEYQEGSNYENLQNLKYSSDYIEYQFGVQKQYRKIDLNKIRNLFNNGQEYNTISDFYNDYGGTRGLAGYHYTFYKGLDSIRKEINSSIQNKISKDNSGSFKINKSAPKYVLIIDEINRGNIADIFGELITLLEDTKRTDKENAEVILPYSNESFSLPPNLYIIGTMNTADRSIALLDIALRRRFDFIAKYPNSSIIGEDGAKTEVEEIDLRQFLDKMNERIEVLLDKDHTIGHSYLMGIYTYDDFLYKFKNRILPLLQEYFYNDYDKIAEVLNQDNIYEDEWQDKSHQIILKRLINDKPLYEINDKFPLEAFKKVCE